jgi:prepilin-type N-terminal cleavage/methylation domain-containing protein
MMQAQAISSSVHHPSSLASRGFTITELLIVIAIIVLVLAMAVPAFNAITGNKSEAAMFNQIGAMLARARTEAVGVQQMRGVMFYRDVNDGSTKLALVRQVDPPTPSSTAVTPRYPMQNIDVYLDLTSDRDVLTLPAGIGVQTIDDNSGSSGYDDRYIGYNKTARHLAVSLPDTDFPYGGVILFDGRGQLVCKSYAFQTQRNGLWTAMGTLLWSNSINPTTDTPDTNHDDIAPIDPTAPGGRPLYLRSQIGLAVFNTDNFTNANLEAHGGSMDNLLGDAQVRSPGSADSAESAEEQWIDANATLAMVNRYNGSLLKGE